MVSINSKKIYDLCRIPRWVIISLQKYFTYIRNLEKNKFQSLFISKLFLETFAPPRSRKKNQQTKKLNCRICTNKKKKKKKLLPRFHSLRLISGHVLGEINMATFLGLDVIYLFFERAFLNKYQTNGKYLADKSGGTD